MPRKMAATFSPRLSAVLTGLVPLRYDHDAADLAGQDVPAHIRAASAVRRRRGRLVIVQDDVNVLALADDAANSVPLLLPAGPGGRRTFGSKQGNKPAKMDLEACVGLPDGRLVAFGSGSTRGRERLVILDEHGATRIVDAADLYALLRDELDFAGSQLNLEGAIVVGENLRLFQRGNGAARGGLAPVNATCDLRLESFVAWLDGGSAPPAPARVTQFALGHAGSVPFTFTDAAATTDGRVAFVACAEASPDATRDGAVLGARFGWIDGDAVSIVDIRHADGRPTVLKIEGIEPRPGEPGVFDVVVDMDRPDEPALLGCLRVLG